MRQRECEDRIGGGRAPYVNIATVRTNGKQPPPSSSLSLSTAAATPVFGRYSGGQHRGATQMLIGVSTPESLASGAFTTHIIAGVTLMTHAAARDGKGLNAQPTLDYGNRHAAAGRERLASLQIGSPPRPSHILGQ